MLGGWLKRREGNNVRKRLIQNLPLPFLAGGKLINMQLLTFSRYVCSLQGDTHIHTHTPCCFPVWLTKMTLEAPAASHVSFLEYFSNLAIGPPISPKQSGLDPARSGLITRPCQSLRPDLRHSGRSPPPQEAAVDKQYWIIRSRVINYFCWNCHFNSLPPLILKPA